MKCNEVKVQKFAQNVTSLQVEVLQKQNTSLQLKVLKKLLKYCNALFLLRYFTTLILTTSPIHFKPLAVSCDCA